MVVDGWRMTNQKEDATIRHPAFVVRHQIGFYR